MSYAPIKTKVLSIKQPKPDNKQTLQPIASNSSVISKVEDEPEQRVLPQMIKPYEEPQHDKGLTDINKQEEEKKNNIAGFKNLGNTCYM